MRAALEAGSAVTVLPGPSAVETALVASGLVAERYAFVGFLPRRAEELDALWDELDGWRWPVVAFESPKRLPASLRSLGGGSPDREVAVCRELTKRFEEIVRGRADDGRSAVRGAAEGEITIVLGPAPEGRGVPTAQASALRPWGGSSPPALPARSPSTSSPAWRDCPGTISTGGLCDKTVIIFDNKRPTA